MMMRWMMAMLLCAAVVGASFLANVPGGLSTANADEQGFDLNAPEVIKHALEQQVGKRVKVRLKGGQDLEGKVAKVGTHAVLLTELTGMEFFDATVKLEEVSAVIVKVRNK